MKIVLSKGCEALVDKEDYDILNQFKWCVTPTGYAIRNARRSEGHRKRILMHRVIIDAPKGMQVDHINGDRLDNRKVNLRLCTNQQNSCNRGRQSNNTSGYKGVSFLEFNSKGYKLRKPWVAKIAVEGKPISLGMYATAGEASQAYAKAATKYHKEFACV